MKKIWDTWSKKDIFECLERKEGNRGLDNIMSVGKKFLDDFTNRYCIYFLRDTSIEGDDDIVYIGQTKMLMRRIAEHKNGHNKKKIKFDELSWIYVDKSEVDFIELLLISIYNPKENSHLTIKALESANMLITYDRYKKIVKKYCTEKDMDKLLSIGKHNAWRSMGFV